MVGAYSRWVVNRINTVVTEVRKCFQFRSEKQNMLD